MNNRQDQWESSYKNQDNFMFYPDDEVIRFVSKYIRKKIGPSEFVDLSQTATTDRILDLGCGIGRHVIFLSEMGLDGYGIDLSKTAVQTAVKRAPHLGKKIIHGDAIRLPWDDKYFQFAISHGTLDSMTFPMAQNVCLELSRVMVPGGLYYCDLISGDDSFHAREYHGEETVNTRHEQGTIQSYFNIEKINKMIGDLFFIEECLLIKKYNIFSGDFLARYHVVFRKK